jgi:hypothetical protein
MVCCAHLESGYSYKILLEYCMGRGQLGCLNHKSEGDIKKDFRKIGQEVMNWIELDAQMHALIYCYRRS